MAGSSSFALIFPRCHSLLSFSFSFTPPSLPLSSEVSFLYWMVQKQNHKLISVTLAMRLDGAGFVSLWGGRIHSTVPQKTPLLQTKKTFFLVKWRLQLSCRVPLCFSSNLWSGFASTDQMHHWRGTPCGHVCRQHLLPLVHPVPFEQSF